MRKGWLIGLVFVSLVMLVGCDGNNNQIINEQPNESQQQEQQQEPQNKEENEQPKQEDDKTKKFDSIKKLGDIEITNITIKLVEKNRCEITANVKNTSDNFIKSTNAEIRVLNENGEVMEIFGGMITSLAPQEPSTFTTYVLKDITNAYDIEFSEAQ